MSQQCKKMRISSRTMHFSCQCRLVRPLWKTVWNFLKKLKMELPFGPAIPLLGLYPKNPETSIQQNLHTPVFIAAQFTIAKCWKQPKCPPVNEWIKKTVVHLHNGILCSRKKKGTPTLHDSLDGTGQHYAKWNKPGNERQIPYDLTYKWNLIKKTNKQAKQNQRHGNKEKADSDQKGGGREEGDNRGKKKKGRQGTCIKDPWTKGR